MLHKNSPTLEGTSVYSYTSPMKRLWLGAIAAVLLCANSLPSQQTSAQPIRIEIKSSWSGLGPSSSGTLTITGRGQRFTANGRKIKAERVLALLAAIEQPVAKEPTLEACGITEQWLLENYKGALEDSTHTKVRNLSPKQVELFRSKFTDIDSARTTLLGLFQGWHTDDYPEMSVMVFDGSRQFEVMSNSQHIFMLPWSGGGPRGGYSCEISRTIAALLPRNFANRKRLMLGQNFRWEFTEQVMRSIDKEWDFLETEFKVGPAVAPVFAQYKVLKSEISNLGSIDLDGGQAWNAVLQAKELPSNLMIGVSLHYNNRALPGVNRFLEVISNYSDLVLSVPWLAKFLEVHTGTKAELRYVNGRSLSTKAEQNFANEMQEQGKEAVIREVTKAAEQSAFLEIEEGTGCWIRAIVLPDKRVLIWHFSSRCDSVLGFDPKRLASWDHYSYRGTATLVGIDGKLVSD